MSGSIIVQEKLLPTPIGATGPQDPNMRPALPTTLLGRNPMQESPLSFSSADQWNADRSHPVNNAALQMDQAQYNGGVLPMVPNSIRTLGTKVR